MRKQMTAILMTVIFVLSGIPVVAAEGEPQKTVSGMVSNAIAEEKDESVLSEEEDRKPAEAYVSKDSNAEANGIATYQNAQSGTCGTNVKWSLSGNTLIISGNGDMQDYSDVTDRGWNNDVIQKIIVQNGVTSVGRLAFVSCRNLQSVELGTSVKVVKEAAFADCDKLTSIMMPGVETLEEYAFQGTAISELTLPATLKSMNALAFMYAKIQNYKVDAGNANYCSEDGVVFSKDKSSLIVFPAEKNIEAYTIPGSVKSVEYAAFIYNSYLKQVIMSNSLTALKESAFQDCQSLVEVTIPDSVKEVGYFVFYRCPKLNRITIGNGLETTGYQMFEECTALQSIDFGGVKKLDSRTFAGCTSLTEVNLPDSVVEIGNGCFGNCYALQKFTAKQVKVIPFQAFLNDSSLVDVQVGEKAERINRFAFGGCWNLTSVTLPANVTYVHQVAFPAQTVITCQNPQMKKFGQNGYRYLEQVSVTGRRKYDYAFQVLNLVNQQRKNNGLPELKMDENLLKSAMERAGENSLCFSHTRPDGGDCFSINGNMIAENVAVNQSSPQSVMTDWMNSEGHKNNILLASAKTIGIGCFETNGVIYWVQCFGDNAQENNCTQPVNDQISQKINIATETFEEANTGNGIVWGGSKKYSYHFITTLDKQNLNYAETAQARVSVVNAGWENARTVLDNEGIIWQSSDASKASVDTDGKVKAVKSGTANITGKLQYYSADPAAVNVTGNEVNVSYRTHVQTYGWQGYVINGKTSGTNGQAKRLEAIQISISNKNAKELGIRYRTHVQTYGWQGWKENGALSGTSGQAKRLEAIQIELTGSKKNEYDVYYRVHAQSYGWLGWAKNGTCAGTSSQAKRLEAIQIVVLPKGEKPDGTVGYSYIELGKKAKNSSSAGMINYMTHVQTYGNQSYVYDGSISGTSGEGKRLEGIKIVLNTNKTGVSGGITYQTHVQTYGWLDWSSDGAFNGTSGKAKRLEAIKIKLTGDMEKEYDVYYRVHSQTYGWLGWVKNGEISGTQGLAKRLEAIQIVILPKGSSAPSNLPAKGNVAGFVKK